MRSSHMLAPMAALQAEHSLWPPDPSANYQPTPDTILSNSGQRRKLFVSFSLYTSIRGHARSDISSFSQRSFGAATLLISSIFQAYRDVVRTRPLNTRHSTLTSYRSSFPSQLVTSAASLWSKTRLSPSVSSSKCFPSSASLAFGTILSSTYPCLHHLQRQTTLPLK